MRFTSIIASVASVASVFAHPHGNTAPRAEGTMGCASNPSEKFLAAAHEMSIAELNTTSSRIATADVSAAATITIQTYFHVVAKSTAASGGYISATALTNQLAVMNSNYAPYGIQFNLVATDYTVNTNWASDGAELTMKKALRKGDYAALNVYFQYAIGGNLGVCSHFLHHVIHSIHPQILTLNTVLLLSR